MWIAARPLLDSYATRKVDSSFDLISLFLEQKNERDRERDRKRGEWVDERMKGLSKFHSGFLMKFFPCIIGKKRKRNLLHG